MHYEVFIPAAQSEDFDVTLTVEADNWMVALKTGLQRCGQSDVVQSVMCDIKEDNSIHVTDASSRRVFKLRELDPESDGAAPASTSPPQQQAAPAPTASSPEAPPSNTNSAAPPNAEEDNIAIDPQALPGPMDPSSTLVITESRELFRQDAAHAKAVRAAVTARNAAIKKSAAAEPTPPAQPSTPKPAPQDAAPPKPAPKAVEPEPIEPESIEFDPFEPNTGPQIAQPIAQPDHITLEPASIKPSRTSTPPPFPNVATLTPPEEPLNTRELNIRRQIKNAPATVMEMPAYEPDREVPKAYLAGKAREMAEKHGKREALGFQPEEARVIDEAMTRSQQMRAHGAESIDEAIEQVVETAVEDVFLEIYDLFDDSMTMERAIDFVLDLAMRAIRPESGSVLFATPDGKSLRFASARGPRADEVLAFTVPMNKGIAGFCTREGASLSISNVQEDPRFYADISQALDYPTKCIICAPFVYEGRVYGCIELLNKKGADSFPLSDANALTYIGKQMGMFIHQTLSNIA